MTVKFTGQENTALWKRLYGSYKPTDRCLGAGCYSQACTEDWAAKVRKAHGERIQFREWVNGK